VARQAKAIALLVLGMALWPGRAVRAGDPHIFRLDVEVRGNEVWISFAMRGAVDPELARRLQSGLDTAIDYDIRLFERNRYWFDQFLEKHRLRIAATYDAISREYVVRDFWDGEAAGTRSARSFAEMTEILLSRSAIRAFRVHKDWPHKHLYVKMKATYNTGHFVALAPVSSASDWKKSQTFKIHDADLK
jgi:hypothetical protein